MTDQQPSARKNLILASLPQADYKKLSQNLTAVTLSLGDVLYEPEQVIDYAYFPDGAVVSLIHTTAQGQGVEVGLVGRDGVVGIPVILGANESPYRAIVQSADGATRIKAGLFKEMFDEGGAFQQAVLRYTHALMSQTSRTAVCNRLHQIEQRLARWLLMIQDRVETSKLQLTHEFIADMLGSGRVGVTLAAGTLQKAGLIEYQRGKLTIINQAGLEVVACECYEIGLADFSRIGIDL